MTILRLSAAFSAVLAVAACAGSTNPETAGLFDNVRNLSNGEYDRQIAAKDAEAAAIVRNNNASKARIGAMQQQASANANEIQQLRAQIAAVREQAAGVRGQIAGDANKIARLNQLEGQVTAIQADVNAGATPAVARAELQRVSAAIRALAN